MRVFIRRVDVAPERRVLKALLLARFWKSELEESLLRPKAFLPDVVIESASIFAGVSSEGDQQDEGAVGQIIVEPVVGSGAVDDHRRLARAQFFGKEFDFIRRHAGADRKS